MLFSHPRWCAPWRPPLPARKHAVQEFVFGVIYLHVIPGPRFSMRSTFTLQMQRAASTSPNVVALSFAHLLQLVFGRAGGCRHIAPTLVAPAAPRTRARRAGAAEDACLSCPDAFYGGFLSRADSYVAGTDRPCSREAIGSVCTKLKAINVSIFARRSHVLVPPRPDLVAFCGVYSLRT